MSHSKQQTVQQQAKDLCCQRELSGVVSCTSLRNQPTNQYFHRSKPFPVRQNKNRCKDLESPRITYISPSKGVIQRQQNNSTFLLNKSEKDRNLCENIKESNFFSTTQFKAICRSALTLNQSQPNNPQMKHPNPSHPERSEDRLTNRQLERQNYKLREKIQKLLKEVAILKQQKQEGQIQKQLFAQTKQQLEFKIQSLQEINSCLQDIIDRFNEKMQALEPQTQSIDSTNDELILENCEIQVNMDSFKEVASWHEQMIENLEKENQSLKYLALDLRKEMHHYQFEAGLLQKMREQMVDERAKRERLEQKTKFLNEKIISLIKQQRKSPDSPISNTSLSFSIDDENIC